MSNKARKQVGLITAVSMLIGSIIGSGIYFKNNNVFQTTNYSALSTGISWILASVLSMLLAFSFAEIGRIHTDTNETGTTLWIKKILPKRFANTLRPFYSLFYFGGYALILSFLASKFFFDAIGVYGWIDPKDVSPAIHLLIGTITVVSLNFAHYVQRKTMSYIQVVSSILKLIPLFVMIIVGLILFNHHHYVPSKDSDPAVGQNLFSLNRSFNFNNVIIALPMILFAYDAFVTAPSMQNRIKDGEKRMPLLITLSMLFVVTLYITLTIIQLVRGTGTISGTLEDIFPTSSADHIRFTLLLFITISALGTTNGFSYLLRVNIENQIKDNQLYLFSYKVKDERKTALFLSIASIISLSLISYFYGFINSAITKHFAFNDSALFINYISEIIPVVSFLTYGIVVLFYLLQRKEHLHNKINDKLFVTFSSMGSILAILLMLYESIYIIPIKPFIDGWTQESAAQLIAFVFCLGASTLIGHIVYSNKKNELSLQKSKII